MDGGTTHWEPYHEVVPVRSLHDKVPAGALKVWQFTTKQWGQLAPGGYRGRCKMDMGERPPRDKRCRWGEGGGMMEWIVRQEQGLVSRSEETGVGA